MKSLVQRLKREIRKEESAEKSKEISDAPETTSGKSTVITATEVEKSVGGNVSKHAYAIGGWFEEQFQTENQPSTGSEEPSSFSAEPEIIGTQKVVTDEIALYPDADTPQAQFRLEDEASVEGSSSSSNPTDNEVEFTSIPLSDTVISNDISQRADEIARWFVEEQMLAGDPNFAESAQESGSASGISDDSLKGSDNTDSNAAVETLEDEEALGEPNAIDSVIADFNTYDSDNLSWLLETDLGNFENEDTIEENTYEEVEDIGEWFQDLTSEKTSSRQNMEDYFSLSYETDLENEYENFSISFEAQLDDEFEDTEYSFTQEKNPRIAVDTYQMWMRQVQRIQPQVRTADNQISTKLLSAAQESDLFQRFECMKQEISSLLDQLPSAVLKGLSAEKQSKSELLSSVINTRNPLEQIRNAIDEIQAGHRSQEVAELKQLWHELSCSVNRLQDIKEVIIQNNLRLVIHIASGCSSHGIERMDLIQEGYIGLMKAIDKFDVNKGYRLSTYATWWIRQAVWRARDNDSHIIRLPNYVIEKNSAFLKSVSELTQKLNREPTRLEIAELMACSLNQIDGLFNLPTKPIQFDLRKILETEADQHAYHDGIEEEAEFQGEFQICDAPHEVALTQSRFLTELDELTDFSFYRAEIASLLAPHEREILEGHLGWNDAKLKPQLEIGAVLAIVRERARQRRLLGREPSLETVIHTIGIPPRIIDEIQEIASEPFEFDLPIKSETLVELAFRLTQVCDQETLPDFLITESRNSPEAELDSKLNTDVIVEVLNTLSPREKLLLEHRFGLIDGREHTLAEIGRQLGISRERVRQIEEDALKKLRHPTRRQLLEELLNARK